MLAYYEISCDFIFTNFSDVSPNTQELLFEIYDHAVKPNRFLGLGIVGVEELLINPSQRQTISLQSRPYESDQVSGTLTVEVTKSFKSYLNPNLFLFWF